MQLMVGDEQTQQIRTLAHLRADIALTRDFVYFQTGSVAPLPDSTQRAIQAALREESGSALGSMKRYGALAQRAETSREALAALLHVGADELAWTQNTSSAIRLAVFSLPWQAGDRLAISGTEHASTRTLAQGLKQVVGCPTTVIRVGDGADYAPEAFLCELERRLTPDHRLLILSHVSCIDGRRLPVLEATRLAHERGVKVLVDGAQSVGQFPIDVKAIDAEFYVGSLHKWLLGPAGAGYLVVAQRHLPEFNPGLLPNQREGRGHAEPPLTAANLAEVGTQSLSLRLGIRHAVDVIQRIGLEHIEAHICELTRHLREGLARLEGFQVLTPDAWERSSGITSLYFPSRSADHVHDLIDRIWAEHRVVVKFQNEFSGIRISVASFNAPEEVEQLLTALAQLVPRT
jgi:selenocysteine lyase/cysteine desulfurase